MRLIPCQSIKHACTLHMAQTLQCPTSDVFKLHRAYTLQSPTSAFIELHEACTFGKHIFAAITLPVVNTLLNTLPACTLDIA